MPQVQYLQEIHDESPMSTFILNKRNVTKWIKSMKGWNGRGWGSMDERFVQCGNATGLNATDEQSLEVYLSGHFEMIRGFVQRNPSHALVEIDIEDPNTGCIMSELFNTTTFWTKSNKSQKRWRRQFLL